MNGSRVLILGGGHSELPLIRAARRLGLSVVTSGNRPDHPGHALADAYIAGDFSDAGQMIEVARQGRCNFVVSAANDYAYLSACEVAHALGLPGFDTPDIARLLHHKHLFKPLASLLGLPVTRFVTVKSDAADDDAVLDLRYPLVVKPVDLTGGKGISVVNDPSGLAAAVASARKLSKQSELVIEEFFSGSLHSYSTIIENGQIVFEYADNEFCHPTPYLVSTSTSIADVPLHILSDLRQQTEKLAKHLALVDGVLHCQFLFGGGQYVILEYTRRCSGDLYSDVVEAVTGVRHAEQFVRKSVGLPLDLTRGPSLAAHVSRHCVFAASAGKFAGITVDPRLADSVLSITEALPRGYRFYSGWKEKSAVVMLRFRDSGSMLNARPLLNSLICCELGDLDESASHATAAAGAMP